MSRATVFIARCIVNSEYRARQVTEVGGAQQMVSLRRSSFPQTRVDSFAEAIGRNTELTEQDAVNFGAVEAWALFFPQLVSVSVDAVQYMKKTSQRFNCSSFSVSFQGEILNMASNYYRYVQSLMGGVESFTTAARIRLTSERHFAGKIMMWKKRAGGLSLCVFLSECVKVCSVSLWVFACVLLPAAMCVQRELHQRQFGCRCCNVSDVLSFWFFHPGKKIKGFRVTTAFTFHSAHEKGEYQITSSSKHTEMSEEHWKARPPNQR